MNTRMGIAQTLADGGEGQITEDAGHENRQEGKMDEVLRIVQDIQVKLASLVGEEQKEVEGVNEEEMANGAGGQ